MPSDVGSNVNFNGDHKSLDLVKVDDQQSSTFSKILGADEGLALIVYYL